MCWNIAFSLVVLNWFEKRMFAIKFHLESFCACECRDVLNLRSESYASINEHPLADVKCVENLLITIGSHAVIHVFRRPPPPKEVRFRMYLWKILYETRMYWFLKISTTCERLLCKMKGLQCFLLHFGISEIAHPSASRQVEGAGGQLDLEEFLPKASILGNSSKTLEGLHPRLHARGVPTFSPPSTRSTQFGGAPTFSPPSDPPCLREGQKALASAWYVMQRVQLLHTHNYAQHQKLSVWRTANRRRFHKCSWACW